MIGPYFSPGVRKSKISSGAISFRPNIFFGASKNSAPEGVWTHPPTPLTAPLQGALASPREQRSTNVMQSLVQDCLRKMSSYLGHFFPLPYGPPHQ